MTAVNRDQGHRSTTWPRWALELVIAPTHSRPLVVATWVAGMVVVFTALTYFAGGTSSIPPHWFYLPIVVAGARFGMSAALITAIVSGLAVGPAMPADVAQGLAQTTSDWVIRMLFFMGVGAVATALTRQASREIVREKKRLASAKQLDRAFKRGQLQLHYQPIISAASGEVTGAEALLRWEDPGSGLVAPDHFVPVAESTGQIVPIGNWVLEEACSQLAAWRTASGDDRLVMAVNIAAAQLTRADIVSKVIQVLDQNDLEPSSLCLEVTETSVIAHGSRAVDTLSALRQLGVSIAIDDFGTGLSSLSYIRSLPFDILKIDGHFLEDIGEHHQAEALIESIVRLARDLEKSTVAEKVETELQWEKVSATGCTHGQGYLFAPPLPPAAFASLIASRQIWPSDHFQVDQEALRER